MASAQSSQDMRRGRDRQPPTLGNPQPRHRAESRRLSDKRSKEETPTHAHDLCFGALDVRHAVRVFSRTANVWTKRQAHILCLLLPERVPFRFWALMDTDVFPFIIPCIL